MIYETISQRYRFGGQVHRKMWSCLPQIHVKLSRYQLLARMWSGNSNLYKWCSHFIFLISHFTQFSLSINKCVVDFKNDHKFGPCQVWCIIFELYDSLFPIMTRYLSFAIDELSKWLSMYWFWLHSTAEIYYGLEHIWTWQQTTIDGF